ncbi:MAG TPA: YkgJ family cysteine cluster protein [Candidatus Nanoarchaeia archaeon]|nr:YkgJ family cysteine cluster protein [Candidatus Nanoarchaeia archaeon]
MAFKCERCGYCCTLKVVLTNSEIAKIKANGFTDFFEKDEEDNKNTIIKRKDNGDCLFLERVKNRTSCRLYSVRPSPCRNYPPYEQDRLCKEFNPRVRAYLYKTK